jgi:hypothetical protein
LCICNLWKRKNCRETQDCGNVASNLTEERSRQQPVWVESHRAISCKCWNKIFQKDSVFYEGEGGVRGFVKRCARDERRAVKKATTKIFPYSIYESLHKPCLRLWYEVYIELFNTIC